MVLFIPTGLQVSHFSDKGKLSDPFYRLEHLGEDQQKAKEAEPLLVRMQRVSNIKHQNDYALNRSLRSKLRVSNICSFLKQNARIFLSWEVGSFFFLRD